MEEGALAARATRPTAPQTSVVSQVLTNMSSGEAVTEAVATETAESSPSVSAQKGQEELEVGVFYLLAACVYLC